MSDSITCLCLVILISGQFMCMKRSRELGLAYYLAVAPLSYFTLNILGNWDTEKICGILFLAYCIKCDGRSWFTRVPGVVYLFYSYALLVTLISSFWVPMEAITTKSPVYTILRPLVQIVTLTIILGIAIEFSFCIQSIHRRNTILKTCIIAIAAGCIYSGYQFLAYNYGLPYTSIRRSTAAGVFFENGAYSIVGHTDVFRPNSFCGEPKLFGALCNVGIVLLIAGLLKINRILYRIILIILFLTGLAFSGSTSAWFSIVLIAILYSLRLFVVRGFFWSLALIVVVILAVYVASNIKTITYIYDMRITERVDGNLLENIELISIRLLLENIFLLVFGAGMGGISFYISREIGSSFGILSPNNGLLSFICNYGIIGLLFVVAMVFKNIGRFLSRQGHEGQYGFIALALIMQCLIFGATWVWILVIGFSLVTVYKDEQCTLTIRRTPCQEQ